MTATLEGVSGQQYARPGLDQVKIETFIRLLLATNCLTKIGQIIAIVVMYALFNDAFSNSYTFDW